MASPLKIVGDLVFTWYKFLEHIIGGAYEKKRFKNIPLCCF